jgi:hypothetical protein
MNRPTEKESTMNPIQDIDPTDLIDFAQRWASLGEVVTDQVERVLDNPYCGSESDDPDNDVNPAAIELAWERLEGLNATLDCALSEFLEAQS